MFIGVRAAVLILGLNVLVSGCGQGAVSAVTGSVSYNGTPVEMGVVSFASDDAASSFSAEIINGLYAAKEAQPGHFKVTVQATSAAKATTSREAFQQQGQASAGEKESPNYIPENASGNGQTVEVKDGAQTLDFALAGPPRQ